jgi:hemerythrin superfamily protein
MEMTSAGEEAPPTDIRDQLRRDHELALAELEALRRESDERRCHAMLGDLRQTWKIHTLAEETVVYRALENIEATDDPAGRRFVEHELIEGLFDKLTRTRADTSEWRARVEVARELIMRHVEAEREVLLPALALRLDSARLVEMGRQFEIACAKLTMLEEAKAA